MASSSPPSSLVLLALRGIDSDHAVDSIDSLEQVDDVLAKLKELKGLLKRRRLDLAVRMEDLVLPVRRLNGQGWLKEEQEGDESSWGGISHEAAFSVGPGLAEVLCTVRSTNSSDYVDFKVDFWLEHASGGQLWRIGDLPDLDGAALQLLEASQIRSWTTPAFLGNGEEEEEEEEEDSQMAAPDDMAHASAAAPGVAAPSDLAHSAAPDAAPHLHVWPVAPASNAAPAAATAADAPNRRALVRRFLADVSAAVLEQMCAVGGKHGLLAESLSVGETSVKRIQRWIMTGDSWDKGLMVVD